MQFIFLVHETYGNKRDGFEVNQSYNKGVIEVKDYSARSVFKAIREKDFVLDSRRVCIGGQTNNYMGGHIDIVERHSGKPLAFLQRVD